MVYLSSKKSDWKCTQRVQLVFDSIDKRLWVWYNLRWAIKYFALKWWNTMPREQTRQMKKLKEHIAQRVKVLLTKMHVLMVSGSKKTVG